jgi:hypothetical protein
MALFLDLKTAEKINAIYKNALLISCEYILCKKYIQIDCLAESAKLINSYSTDIFLLQSMHIDALLDCGQIERVQQQLSKYTDGSQRHFFTTLHGHGQIEKAIEIFMPKLASFNFNSQLGLKIIDMLFRTGEREKAVFLARALLTDNGAQKERKIGALYNVGLIEEARALLDTFTDPVDKCFNLLNLFNDKEAAGKMAKEIEDPNTRLEHLLSSECYKEAREDLASLQGDLLFVPTPSLIEKLMQCGLQEEARKIAHLVTPPFLKCYALLKCGRKDEAVAEARSWNDFRTFDIFLDAELYEEAGALLQNMPMLAIYPMKHIELLLSLFSKSGDLAWAKQLPLSAKKIELLYSKGFTEEAAAGIQKMKKVRKKFRTKLQNGAADALQYASKVPDDFFKFSLLDSQGFRMEALRVAKSIASRALAIEFR